MVLIAFQIVNMPSIETLSGVLRYIRTAAKWNVQMLTFPSVFSADILRHAASGDFNGILLHQPIDRALGDEILQSKVPLVIIGNSDERLTRRKSAIAFVDADNQRIGRLAAQHFLRLGKFRSFGFIPDIPHTRWSRSRMDGFAEELRRHGISVSVFHSRHPEKSPDYAADLRAWISKLATPSAVLLVGDYRAFDFFNACAAVGKSIPEDVAVLGVDNNAAICDSLSPTLTSVEPSFETEGYEAARLLDGLMRRNARIVRATRIAPVQVVERESSSSRISGAVLVERAMASIRHQAHQPITASDVATQLGVSPQLLSLRFRQYMRESVRTTIIRTRLESARQLLCTSSQSLASIARQCGFRSANYLSHVFKRYLKVSPSQFRTTSRRKG